MQAGVPYDFGLAGFPKSETQMTVICYEIHSCRMSSYPKDNLSSWIASY